MRSRVILIGLVLVVVGGAFTWFWLLASVPRTEPVEVTLTIEQPPVMVMRVGEGTTQNAEDGMTLSPGDTVRTGTGGRAVIHFFGLAESRMDEESHVVIRDAVHDDAIADSLSVQLQLTSGRVWSRVLRLFDVDSGFSIETPAVVATVRGTAFDVAFGDDEVTRVWVADSAVTVLPASVRDRGAMLRQLRGTRHRLSAGTSTRALTEMTDVALGALPAGEMATYDAQGTPTVHRRLSAEDRVSTWFVANVAQDTAFMERADMDRRAELARLGGARPDQFRAGITRLSERLHLAVAGTEREERSIEQYLARRVARLVDLVENGKTGLASQEFARLENDVRSQLRDDPDGRLRVRIRSALLRSARLVEHADTRSPLYPFKQRMEDLILVLQEGDGAAMLFTRLVAVDARINEASRLLDEEELDAARVALDAARGGIENVSRDAEPVLATIPATRQEALIGKIMALIAREASERSRLEELRAAREAGVVNETMLDVAATSTTPVLPTVPPVVAPSTPPAPTPPVVVTPAPVFTSIRLAFGTSPILVGKDTDLIVSGVRNDGSTQDVSARSTFRIVSGTGVLNGLRFMPTVAGTVVLEASYSDEGVIRTAQVTAPAVGIAVLQSLAVTPSASTLKNGDRITLTAIATYTDGSTKDVTGSVTWSFTPTTGGTLASNVFTGINVPGRVPAPVPVTIQATYTEGAVLKIGSVGVTVL